MEERWLTVVFSTGEMTSFVIAFGDWESMTVPRKFLDYWFGESERIIPEVS